MFASFRHYREYCAGSLLVLIGAGTMYQSSQYGLRSMTSAGVFPMGVGVVLLLCGVIVLLTGRYSGEEGGEEFGAPEWKGWICIIGGIFAWIVLADRAGLLPATFACVFLSALGDRTMRWKEATILAAAVSGFGALLFCYLLKIQLPAIVW